MVKEFFNGQIEGNFMENGKMVSKLAQEFINMRIMKFKLENGKMESGKNG